MLSEKEFTPDFNYSYKKVQFFRTGPLKTNLFPNNLPPLSIYIHVPWCTKKCPYCDFNVHQSNKKTLPESSYIEAIQADLEQALPMIWERKSKIISIFIGGGTPSLLSSSAIDKLLEIFRTLLNIRSDIEITMEVNPETVESGKFHDYVKSGINRFSLGIQSFNDNSLTRLGRMHNSTQSCAAIEIAQKAANRINLDIMFGLPGQNLQESLLDIRKALSFGTEHLSVYQLSIEPDTFFFKIPPEIPHDDLICSMQDAIQIELNNNDLRQYEVSSYAINGAESLHNLNYWEFGDYLGLGPGAHGKISCNGKVIRQKRLNNPKIWIKNAIMRDGSHISEERVLTKDELRFEFMLNVLRLKNGVNINLFFERTGLPIDEISEKIEKGIKLGLLERNLNILKTTSLGWNFLSELQEIFL